MRKALWICLAAGILAASSCLGNRLEKNLDPESKEFYSTVRYIITRQEKKIFLDLAPPDRPAFIEEFWAKRDPDPETEINEFQNEYFQLIEEANVLFKQGSTPGWIQERGRVYITLGPPDNRQTYPRGMTFYGVPTEIWYYGFFPIVFTDANWTGNYKMDPLSAQHLSQINQTQVARRPMIPRDKVNFDFDLDIQAQTGGPVVFRFKIPYQNMWFVVKDEKLQTMLLLRMEIFDSSDNEIWRYDKEHLISLDEKNFEEMLGQHHQIEVKTELGQGEFQLAVEMEDVTNEKRIRKTYRFKN